MAHAAVAVLAGLAGGGVIAWILQLAQWPGETAAPVAGFIACALLAWRHAAGAARTLAWDGSTWQWQGAEGELRVMIDIGPWMLLAFHGAGRRRRAWLPVSAASAGPAWHTLRAAVYCRASTFPR